MPNILPELPQDVAEALLLLSKTYPAEHQMRWVMDSGAEEIRRLRAKIAGYAGFVPEQPRYW